MPSYKDFLREGENIILEMHCADVFEGDVVNVGQNMFELVNVKQHNNPNKLQGVYTFYRSEIEKVYKLKSTVSSHIEHSLISKSFQVSSIDRNEYDRLRKISEDFLYLDNADSRYYKAVADLQNSETIGVVPLGMDKTSSTDVKILGICTRQQVYLFDLVHVKNRAFYPELKQIFESKYICKVLHGGMAFVDILFKNYKVYTCNIFDTQLTDLIIETRKFGNTTPKSTKSLAHCLKVYVKLPPSILKLPQERSVKQWSERPLTEMDKLYASQLCTYLLKVQQLMKNNLLKKVSDTIKSVHSHVHCLSDSDFEIYSNSNKNTKAVHSLIPLLSNQKINKTDADISGQSLDEQLD